MKFYRILSKAYDDIFPFSQMTYSFLKKYANGSVLDIGCATGEYLKRFHADGIDGFGVEYVPELIKYEKGVEKGDMRSLPDKFDGKFALLYCIGNTLAHCTDKYDATKILGGFRKTLKEGGHAVIQILNYELILENKPVEITPIKTDHFHFRREYIYLGEKIQFKGTLSSDGQSFSSSVILYPLTSTELGNAAKEAGFSSCSFVGDFSGDPFKADKSFMLVAVLSN